VTVRVAGPEDVEALARLRAAWRGEPATPSFVAAFQAWHVREPDRWWWLAVDGDGEPVGMVNLKVFERMPSPGAPSSRWGYLANLFVLPAARGHGLGAELVKALLRRADDADLVRVVLSPSEESRPLYARHGFVSADELLVRRRPRD
jgi:GNAT superfamily N-acetyltransferase